VPESVRKNSGEAGSRGGEARPGEDQSPPDVEGGEEAVAVAAAVGRVLCVKAEMEMMMEGEG